MKIFDTFKKLKQFLEDSYQYMEEASLSSNMKMEGYTDFEIKLAIQNLREIRRREK